jgi:hypothetical protein
MGSRTAIKPGAVVLAAARPTPGPWPNSGPLDYGGRERIRASSPMAYRDIRIGAAGVPSVLAPEWSFGPPADPGPR